MIDLIKTLRKRDWLCAAGAVLLIVAGVALDLRLPEYMSEMTVLVQTPGSATAEVMKAGGRMLLCALGSLVTGMLVAVLSARIATDFGHGMRHRIFRKVQSFSMAEVNRFSTPSLITRTTNDVMQVQMLVVMGLQSMIKAPIMAAWAISKIAGKGAQWSFSTAAAVVILLTLVAVMTSITLPKFKKLQQLTDELNRITRENLSGLKVVRAYNAESYQQGKFEDANSRLTATHLFTGRAMAFMSPIMQLTLNALTLSIYIFGAFMIDAASGGQKLTIFSDMVVFSQYAMQVVMSFMMLVMIFVILPRAQVSAKRIIEVLHQPLSVENGKGKAQQKAGEVEFRNVSFRYPDSDGDAIQNISFKAEAGETVAFIGATGCGKTTLINLIPRFYDATEGTVLVGGVDVKDLDIKELRNGIGYVSQKAHLFRGSVTHNVLYGDNGREQSPEDAVAAVHTAEAAEFVEALPEGYDAPIAEGGGNLSGGQKQRISIARAIARRPKIFIFDDSFSALDYKTDRALRNRLQKDCKGATKLIVAQRVGTIMDADKIIVLDDGCIVGIGTHRSLLESCDVYRQIAESQLSKEELA